MTQYSITINGEQLPIIVRKRRGTRRFTIRYQPLTHAVSLTLPLTASIRQGLHFTKERSGWIARQIEKKPKQILFEEGQVIPVLGKNYALKHIGGRGVVTMDGENILVPGDVQFMARRVREFLKTQAKQEVTRLAYDKAKRIGKPVGKISLRDPRSCWGSCSHHSGNLSFSWRLVLAPPMVLEYLVAHEVAHLKEHNHSPKFWDVVAGLFPAYKEAKAWLKRCGQGLYTYG